MNKFLYVPLFDRLIISTYLNDERYQYNKFGLFRCLLLYFVLLITNTMVFIFHRHFPTYKEINSIYAIIQ